MDRRLAALSADSFSTTPETLGDNLDHLARAISLTRERFAIRGFADMTGP